MKWSEFINLVANMRDAQKDYFRTRSSEALADSKLLEHQVDEIVRKGQEYYRNHPGK